MRTFFILLLLQAGLVLSVKASYDYDSNCRLAHYQIMCLRFNEARQLLSLVKRQKPSNDIPYILDDYIDFLTLMIGEQESDFKALKPNLDKRIDRLEDGDKGSPWYRFGLAETYLHWSFTRAKFGEYFTSALEINKAYRLLEENQKLFPSFLPNKAGLGILHVLIGAVPVNYVWIVKLMSFRGTINQGLAELNDAYQGAKNNPENSFMLPECIVLLSFATINLGNNKETARSLSDNLENTSRLSLINDSPLICYAVANMKIKLGQNEKAISILQNRPQGNEFYPFYYLDYLLGVAKQNRLDEGAYPLFITYLAKFKGINYLKAAYQHIAWYYLLKGDKTNYDLYMNRVLLRGGEQVDNDKQAARDAKNKEVPDLHLLKSRLLFDGGYYQQAIAELEKVDLSRTSDPVKSKLEFTYRSGRIFHEWGKEDQALTWYAKTVEAGKNLPWYFAANASLNMGLIYENRHDFPNARQAYQRCLTLSFDEYRTSITQKAKAGLNRIGK